jgi:hypothetical protein
MNKGVLKTILLFLATAITAVFADQVLFPYFVEAPLLYKYKLDQNQIYVSEKVQTTIQENKALKEAVGKAIKVVVFIKSATAKGAVIEESGLILTSDGLVAALSDLMPAGAKTEIFIDGQTAAFEVLKRDKAGNLALIKVDKSNLATGGFFPIADLRLGERIFLLSGSLEKPIVNEGIVRSVGANLIETNIIENSEAAGSPVFDIEGNILGLSQVSKDGRVTVLSVAKIKELSGL